MLRGHNIGCQGLDPDKCPNCAIVLAADLFSLSFLALKKMHYIVTQLTICFQRSERKVIRKIIEKRKRTRIKKIKNR